MKSGYTKLEDLFINEENEILEENKNEDLSDRLLIAGFTIPNTLISVKKYNFIRRLINKYLK